VTSPAELAVVDHLLEAGPLAATWSARQIAAAAGTSDATVVRTARSLGYASLRALRDALVSAEADEPDLAARLDLTLTSSAGASGGLAGAIEHHLRALDQLANRVAEADFDAATALLARAGRIWWCGVGPSAHLAAYAAFLSRRLGRHGGAFTSSGTDHADELLDLAAGDVAVVLSYGRRHPYVRVLLERAADVGADVVLVTDTVDRRAEPAVAVRLEAGRGAPAMFATHGPTIVLLEALVLAVASHEPAQAEASIDDLNHLRRQLTGKRLDVDPR
jgi:DNA-binding MurR/RpiR family transcriptional regulator